MLRQRELKLYQWMASYLPVLLIRLGIDEQTAFARKPDHQLAALQEKIAVTPQLTFNGAKILNWMVGNQPMKLCKRHYAQFTPRFPDHQNG